MQLKDLITSRVCGNTVFEESWIGYCDECQQHWTAISSEEAHFMATAHLNYFSVADISKPSAGEDEGEFVYYPKATKKQLSKLDFENYMCAVYIIDEGNNITYNYGDDYGDKTPNEVSDIETMIQIQKQLGLQ